MIKHESLVAVMSMRAHICSISTDCTHENQCMFHPQCPVDGRHTIHDNGMSAHDVRAAQTKNTTGHESMTFKRSGVHRLELVSFTLVCMFTKLSLVLFLLYRPTVDIQALCKLNNITMRIISDAEGFLCHLFSDVSQKDAQAHALC